MILVETSDLFLHPRFTTVIDPTLEENAELPSAEQLHGRRHSHRDRGLASQERDWWVARLCHFADHHVPAKMTQAGYMVPPERFTHASAKDTNAFSQTVPVAHTSGPNPVATENSRHDDDLGLTGMSAASRWHLTQEDLLQLCHSLITDTRASTRREISRDTRHLHARLDQAGARIGDLEGRLENAMITAQNQDLQLSSLRGEVDDLLSKNAELEAYRWQATGPLGDRWSDANVTAAFGQSVQAEDEEMSVALEDSGLDSRWQDLYDQLDELLRQ